ASRTCSTTFAGFPGSAAIAPATKLRYTPVRMVAPGRFQWRMWWAALTALALVVLAGTFTGVGWLVVKAMGFLQPVLMPLAVAGILAYLLNPVVDWLEKRRRIGRTWAVVAVFGIFF